MNKTEIRAFAIRARKKLIDGTIRKMEETKLSVSAEECAYTWFNRIIAIRFMEVNGYLPHKIRLLSSSYGKPLPDIIYSPFSCGINFSANERKKIEKLSECKNYDELFSFIFIRYCEELCFILPEFFCKTENEFDRLFSINITDSKSVVSDLLSLGEECFDVSREGQVEIIGWLYQYYNSEPKNKVYSLLKQNIKISQDNLPAATQLFTPDWIVRYMVQSSVLPFVRRAFNINEKRFTGNNDYYIKSPNHILRKSRSQIPFKLEDIKILDPCMGSGHILVYAFDILMQLYSFFGIDEAAAAESIIKNNLCGFDIDRRAYQLAYFAVMMKARHYSKDLFSKKTELNLYTVSACEELDDTLINFISGKNKRIRNALKQIKSDMKQAGVAGSLLKVQDIDFKEIFAAIEKTQDTNYTSLIDISNQKVTEKKVLPFIKASQALSGTYHIVITNPPYLSYSGMNKELHDYLKSQFKDGSRDLCTAFIERCLDFAKPNGEIAMITQQSFMYLSGFEKLRKTLIGKDIQSLVHLGSGAFDDISGEVVKTCAFVLRNSSTLSYKTSFVRLTNQNSEQEKRAAFLHRDFSDTFTVQCQDFLKIPSSTFAYMCSPKLIKCFDLPKLADIAAPRQGLACGNVQEFRRNWYEVDFSTICFNAATIEEFHKSKAVFAPINDGGSFRKWYGNNLCVLKFNKEAYLRLLSSGNHLPSRNYYFKKGITWTAITSRELSLRYFEEGFLFSNAGMAVFDKEENLLALCALLNSTTATLLMSAINESLNYNRGDIAKIPIARDLLDTDKNSRLLSLVRDCIKSAKKDWDSRETSYGFKIHPLI